MATKITKNTSEKKKKKEKDIPASGAKAEARLEKFGVNFSQKIMRVRISEKGKQKWREIDTARGAGKKLLREIEEKAAKLI